MFSFKKKIGTKNNFLILNPEMKKLSFQGEQTILDICIDHKIDIHHSCGGNGSCGTCKIEIIAESHLLDLKNNVEIEWSESRGLKKMKD